MDLIQGKAGGGWQVRPHPQPGKRAMGMRTPEALSFRARCPQAGLRRKDIPPALASPPPRA